MDNNGMIELFTPRCCTKSTWQIFEMLDYVAERYTGPSLSDLAEKYLTKEDDYCPYGERKEG